MRGAEGSFAWQAHKSCTASTSPTTERQHSRPSTDSVDLYATGQLIEFHHIVDTVIAWGDEILAWHDTGRPSNGRIEGTNNLLQVLQHVAHGFSNAADLVGGLILGEAAIEI